MQKASQICPQCKNYGIGINPHKIFTKKSCEAYNCLTCTQCVIDSVEKEEIICKEYKWTIGRIIDVDGRVPCNHPIV